MVVVVGVCWLRVAPWHRWERWQGLVVVVGVSVVHVMVRSSAPRGVGGLCGSAVVGRGGDGAGGGRCGIGASGGRGRGWRGRADADGSATLPGPARVAAPVRCEFVQAAVPGRAAILGCRGTAVVAGVGEGAAAGVPRGLGSGVVRRGWAQVSGWGAVPSWRARWRVPWPVLAFLTWWVSGGGIPPCPRGGDGAWVCQRCASLRHVSRPLM